MTFTNFSGDQLPRYEMVHCVFDADVNLKSVDYGGEGGLTLVNEMANELREEILHASKSAAEDEGALRLHTATITISEMGKQEWHEGSMPAIRQYLPIVLDI